MEKFFKNGGVFWVKNMIFSGYSNSLDWEKLFTFYDFAPLESRNSQEVNNLCSHEVRAAEQCLVRQDTRCCFPSLTTPEQNRPPGLDTYEGTPAPIPALLIRTWTWMFAGGKHSACNSSARSWPGAVPSCREVTTCWQRGENDDCTLKRGLRTSKD